MTEMISNKAARWVGFPALVVVLAILSLGVMHVNSEQAEATCLQNLKYFTDHASGTVDGVEVKGKVQLRGVINRGGWLDWLPSCLHGYVESTAESSIDQVSWEAWLYVNGDLEENWGSSCINCKKGGAKSDHDLVFNSGLGVYTMIIKGSHVWIEDDDTLRKRTNRSSGPL